MRFYQYKATDKSGRPAEGTIRAASADAAQSALVAAGYTVKSVQDVASKPAAPAGKAKVPLAAVRPPGTAAKAPIAQAVQLSAAPTQVQKMPGEQPRVMTINSPAAPVVTPSTNKTKFGRDRDLYFLFSQLSQYFHTGISPQTAMVDLAKRTPARYHGSLEEAAQALAEGKRLSDVFVKYPYLYSPDIIGTLRAGEASGFLSEACSTIADQKETSARLKRKLNVFLWMFVATLISFPICYAIITGSLKSMQQQDKAGGSLPIAGTITHAVGVDMLHTLPWSLPTMAGLIGFLIWWHSMRMRMARHQLVLRFPILGGRARSESISRFTWTMGMVSRAGLSPQSVFEIAAESVPNMAIRAQLMASAATMHESERLSAALTRSGTLPVEYTHIVATGEMTGDVPRALADISRATDADFRGRDAGAAVSTGILFYIGLAILTTFMVGFLYQVLYGGMIGSLLDGL